MGELYVSLRFILEVFNFRSFNLKQMHLKFCLNQNNLNVTSENIFQKWLTPKEYFRT